MQYLKALMVTVVLGLGVASITAHAAVTVCSTAVGCGAKGGGGAPEPASMLLLAVGGCVVGIKRYKNRKSSKTTDLQ